MQEQQNLLMEATRVFTPGAPVSTKDCFSGRKEQLNRIVEAIPSPGRHPIIFGQRGVGKTSLANILDECIANIVPVKTNCDGTDTFQAIWFRLLSRTIVNVQKEPRFLSQKGQPETVKLADVLKCDPKAVVPSDIAEVLTTMGSQWVLFIVDEFDKVTDPQAKSKMADLIKNLSDNNRYATIALVGVGRSIDELIGHHPSVERNLVQIELPTMNDEEIQSIVANGCALLGIKVSEDVLREVAMLSNGFPHYAHLLGLHAAKACLKESRTTLDLPTFHAGCTFAVEDAIEKYRDLFAKATTTTRQSRYPRILCACAYAKHNDRGVFQAGNVVDAMKSVFGDDVTIPSLVPALGSFCSESGGQVLTGVQVRGRMHYKFTDPMMRPFLRMRARTL
ncbi:MAG: hypothetical protein MUP47_10085 [Phycisphaerae bacterium]|nr:hypothetical protein [Phycisphaerae bacterium]